jgi:hypothetical protein
MKGSIPSPVEEEETLESDADRVGRTPLPKSAFRELLQASPSTRSTGARTTTLTPTPSDESILRKRSLLAPKHPGRPQKLAGAEENQQPVAGNSKHTQSAGPSSRAVQPPRSSRSRDVIDLDEDSAEDNGTEIVAQRIVEEDPRNSKSTHGPRPNQEPINIDSDDDQLDIQSLSSSSIHSISNFLSYPFQPSSVSPYLLGFEALILSHETIKFNIDKRHQDQIPRPTLILLRSDFCNKLGISAKGVGSFLPGLQGLIVRK